ncbi:putative phosphonate metabolism protein [Chelatococcus caeni]|uniref:Putative phosphonate metabolism protein n=1 Tax=Chelatococcus caeni TaxID=1348468 RepID=A0A840C6J9_9HYPH|nr:DUF1045 domain-containing protein [Chelatococcus caeni]MBB4019662.1 putative phosphonate metabolism protein [Chelatococcus caeni]
MSSNGSRYAIYFAPHSDDPLWRFGSGILGYDGATGEEVPQIVPRGLDAEAFHRLTEEPRRYAFHATLKAPFRLAEGQAESDLIAALVDFAEARPAFTLPRLILTAIGRRPAEGAFLALVEARPSAELAQLERALVPAFEPFRAPANGDEIAKRRPETLSERQRQHLETYGYPYVLEEFRFHMTLTGRVPREDVARTEAALALAYAEHVPPADVLVDALALCRQDGAGERFRIVGRAALGA